MRQLKITQSGECAEKQKGKKVQTTLLQHIENIIELIESSNLSDEFYENAQESINFIAKEMNLTENQTILFPVFVEMNDEYQFRLKDISRYIGCKNIKILGMMADIDELEKRRLIRCRRNNDPYYRIPLCVINSLKNNKVYEPESISNLNIDALFTHLGRLFGERDDKEISFTSLIEELRALIEANPSLSFCRKVNEYYDSDCFDEEFVILLCFCHLFINKDDDCVGFHDFEYLFESAGTMRHIKSNFKKNQSLLFINGILENCNDGGFSNREYFKLTDKAKKELFAEMDVKINQDKKGLILHKNIVVKELFYNEKEKSQLSQLSSLLIADNFTSIQERLTENGMRKGFASLFYGAPGTGKTETVYQLARATGRDIMQVDISEAKSCWFGESEKRIKAIFDKYESFVKSCALSPILLFNEADAIISKRKGIGNNGSVAQTENTIQNIILQEMENLEGIMIATTNLTENLDDAFERRFLFKIEFCKPDVLAKEKIWQTMLPSLTEKERMELANSYDFSGGQIENIVRKYTIESILKNAKPSLESIHGFCQNEFLYKNNIKKIGFQ